MDKKTKIIFYSFLVIDLILALICFAEIFRPTFSFGNFAVLNPQGIIAQKERAVMITATLIMLVVVVPVYLFLFFVVWKYRANKNSSAYSPQMQSNKKIGSLLWAIPITIIFSIGVLNWKSTHDLDPYKSISSAKKPITIEVVALQWKWLFIYPEENIATVNFIEFPENTPVNFKLTADAPMNSFWIPQLGGQMYAMAGMETKLHLIANHQGDFAGSAAEINGSGLAGMRFIAKSVSDKEFNSWVESVKASSKVLNLNEYNSLAEPSENNPKILYSKVENNLYNSIMEKFMAPMPAKRDSTLQTKQMEGMQ